MFAKRMFESTARPIRRPKPSQDTDYDMENPITKNEGMLRKMEKRLASSDISEEERKQLQQQIKTV